MKNIKIMFTFNVINHSNIHVPGRFYRGLVIYTCNGNFHSKKSAHPCVRKFSMRHFLSMYLGTRYSTRDLRYDQKKIYIIIMFVCLLISTLYVTVSNISVIYVMAHLEQRM